MASFIDQTIKAVSRHVSTAIGRVAGRKAEDFFEKTFGSSEDGHHWKSSTSQDVWEDLQERWKNRFGK